MKIPVTYKCWECGSELTVEEEYDTPIPSKEVWNICSECQNRSRARKEVRGKG